MVEDSGAVTATTLDLWKVLRGLDDLGAIALVLLRGNEPAKHTAAAACILIGRWFACYAW